MGRLEDVVEATEKLEERLHEGRALLKDLKQERKRCEQATNELHQAVNNAANQEIENMIDYAVQQHMIELSRVVEETKDGLHDRLIASFDRLTNILMYGTGKPDPDDRNVIVQLMEQNGLLE